MRSRASNASSASPRPASRLVLLPVWASLPVGLLSPPRRSERIARCSDWSAGCRRPVRHPRQWVSSAGSGSPGWSGPQGPRDRSGRPGPWGSVGTTGGVVPPVVVLPSVLESPMTETALPPMVTGSHDRRDDLVATEDRVLARRRRAAGCSVAAAGGGCRVGILGAGVTDDGNGVAADRHGHRDRSRHLVATTDRVLADVEVVPPPVAPDLGAGWTSSPSWSSSHRQPRRRCR